MAWRLQGRFDPGAQWYHQRLHDFSSLLCVFLELAALLGHKGLAEVLGPALEPKPDLTNQGRIWGDSYQVNSGIQTNFHSACVGGTFPSPPCSRCRNLPRAFLPHALGANHTSLRKPPLHSLFLSKSQDFLQGFTEAPATLSHSDLCSCHYSFVQTLWSPDSLCTYHLLRCKGVIQLRHQGTTGISKDSKIIQDPPENGMHVWRCSFFWGRDI